MTQTSLRQDNLVLLGRLFAGIATADLDAVSEVLAPDVQWHISGRHPLSGTYVGPRSVLRYFARLAKAAFQTEVQFRGADGDLVVQMHRGWSGGGDQGPAIDQLWILICRIRDGKITAAWSVPSDQHAANAFFQALYPWVG